MDISRGILDLNAAGINLDQSKLTLTPQVKTKDGKTLAAADGNGSVTVKLVPNQSRR